MLSSLISQLRFLINIRYINEITKGAVGIGSIFSIIRAVNKEFEGDKSWEEGKTEFKLTCIFIVFILITLSWII